MPRPKNLVKKPITENKQFAMAKAQATKEVFKNLFGYLEGKPGVGDPLFRIYRCADKIGFETGSPAFRAGLPPESLREQFTVVTVAGHTTTTTFGNLLSTIALATLNAIEEIRDERAGG